MIVPFVKNGAAQRRATWPSPVVATALHGAFHLLRLLQTYHPLRDLAVVSAPRIKLRLLDHWDNLDRSVERGYAGLSLWDWSRLPDSLDPRYRDYARANASLGINGTQPRIAGPALQVGDHAPDLVAKPPEAGSEVGLIQASRLIEEVS